MPVPTRAFCALRHGTACLCMFAPIRALFASLCSKKGISDAATDTIWPGAISIYSTSFPPVIVNSFLYLEDTCVSLKEPFGSISELA